MSTTRGYAVAWEERLYAKAMTPGRYEGRVRRVTQARLGGGPFEAIDERSDWRECREKGGL